MVVRHVLAYCVGQPPQVFACHLRQTMRTVLHHAFESFNLKRRRRDTGCQLEIICKRGVARRGRDESLVGEVVGDRLQGGHRVRGRIACRTAEETCGLIDQVTDHGRRFKQHSIADPRRRDGDSMEATHIVADDADLVSRARVPAEGGADKGTHKVEGELALLVREAFACANHVLLVNGEILPHANPGCQLILRLFGSFGCQLVERGRAADSHL